MFDSNTPPPAGTTSGTPTPVATESWNDIHTMPSVATPASAPESVPTVSGGTSINKKWIIVSGVVLGVVLISAGLYFWLSGGKSPSSEVTPPVTTPPVESPAPAPTPAPVVVPVEERDRTRFRDIKNIQTALDLYFNDVKKYPIATLPIILGLDSTSVLSTAGFTSIDQKQGAVYLPTVPKNIEPGGTGYLYESADGSTYTIRFTLEQGTGGLSAGEHKTTPQGLGNVVETPTEAPTSHTLTLPTATVDTDADGLTDAEELIFGSDKTKSDTDNDAYNDGLEVSNDYDPIKPDSARLSASSKMAKYHSDRFAYTIMYPSAWLAKAKDTEGSEVIFSGAGDEFIEVLAIDNPEHLSAKDWYSKQVPGVTADQIPTVKVNNNDWVLSFDGETAYLATDRYIFTLAYNAGTKTEVSYYQLYRAMLRSFAQVSQ